MTSLITSEQIWVAILWNAMAITGKGYRRSTLKRRPPKGASKWRGERRPDKVEVAARNARIPIFTGKLNYRRSDQNKERV